MGELSNLSTGVLHPVLVGLEDLSAGLSLPESLMSGGHLLHTPWTPGPHTLSGLWLLCLRDAQQILAYFYPLTDGFAARIPPEKTVEL